MLLANSRLYYVPSIHLLHLPLHVSLSRWKERKGKKKKKLNSTRMNSVQSLRVFYPPFPSGWLLLISPEIDCCSQLSFFTPLLPIHFSYDCFVVAHKGILGWGLLFVFFFLLPFESYSLSKRWKFKRESEREKPVITKKLYICLPHDLYGWCP